MLPGIELAVHSLIWHSAAEPLVVLPQVDAKGLDVSNDILEARPYSSLGTVRVGVVDGRVGMILLGDQSHLRDAHVRCTSQLWPQLV
jgi:hypothetical protein